MDICSPPRPVLTGTGITDPTDWNNTANVAGMLSYMRDTATLFSDTTPKYGRSHGWYCTFVRVNTDSIGGWTAQKAWSTPASSTAGSRTSSFLSPIISGRAACT